ncbi:TetR/AcrR family transcriptional regulator C-terminal domain-containing protein [Williamsia sp. CHRR-6]|uniref:TetR/AcrR family transcriptional regulator C-terminal domain-containing protein n=1 Tax=Williamsia sp. CHRR-6 TaxID=2835871 RepID=UPI0027DAC5A4|nr:TetR/AcrR family transcriptional regulator C-terminal domain-containing protein [Williamsia sp. CHRR-6]
MYNHVGGRGEIIELLRDRVMASVLVRTAAQAQSWSDTVSAAARSSRDAYCAHPRLIPLLTGQTVGSRMAVATYETLARAFRAAGLTDVATLDAITIRDAFVLGSALDLAAPQEVWSAEATDDPDLLGALAHAKDSDRADRAFDSGLAVLIAGWRATVDEAS